MFNVTPLRSPNTREARNARVQARYDELMRVGKHGHYETMFQVVQEEVERGMIAAYERGAAWMRENPDCSEYVTKAACDYADKATSPTNN